MEITSAKLVMLITYRKENDISHKLEAAVTAIGGSLLRAEANFEVFAKVLEGQVGLAIFDRVELGKIADYFHRAMRVLGSDTPVMMITSQRIILDHFGTRSFAKDQSPQEWENIIAQTLKQDQTYTEAVSTFSERLEKVKQLTGEPLLKAIEAARSETLDELSRKIDSESSSKT